MSLYTGSGDDGTTGLFGGERARKDSLRVEAYGTVDELNAALGLAMTSCDANRPLHKRYVEILTDVQSQLLDLGADLATPLNSGREDKLVRINAEHITALEAMIDEIDAGNDPLASLILPGGTKPAAHLHVARTVCRRAERAVVALSRAREINNQAVIYLNRLGDLLFAMARRANKDADLGDVPWSPRDHSQDGK